MISFIIPLDSDKNIARSYQKELLDSDSEWVCFIDGDAIFTSSFFGKQLEECIRANPEYSMFTCMTNRIGNPRQRAGFCEVKSNDYHYHRRIGSNYWTINHTECDDITTGVPASGVLMLIKREDSLSILQGLSDQKGMLGIDNYIHLKLSEAGFRIGLLKGIYMYHYYSNWDGINPRNSDHLK